MMDNAGNTSTNWVYEEDFRDSIATVDEMGKRLWVYPKKPAGYYHRLRIFASTVLLSLLFAGPFIKINGQPLLLLNFLERRFIIAGQAFWPQDFMLLALTLITFFVFMILFTVAFGRLWCGWMCPQTLFMEMVFRKIEFWIEGDANDQRKLNKEPWHAKKILKKGSKQLVFLAIAILIAHTAMAYIIGIENVVAIVQDSPSDHLAGFIGLVGFTLIFYSVFAYFREQACVVVCPYGRLQSVLLVKDSIVVAYDWLRGEPRGKIKKDIVQDARRGDCIDCKLCLHVCPTGIDIRNGTQLECVNCTACIDACDEVMVKIGKPKGLIRFASFHSIAQGVQKIFTPRVFGYSIVLTSLLLFLGFMVGSRSDVDTTILKVSGTLYQKRDNGSISNLYNVQFINKTFEKVQLQLRIESPSGASLIKPDGDQVTVPAEDLLKTIYFVEIPADQIKSVSTTLYIGVYNDLHRLERLKVKFIGPVNLKPAKP